MTESNREFSVPLSDVTVFRTSDGSRPSLSTIISFVVSAFEFSILDMKTKPVFLSTKVFNPTLLFFEIIEPVSQ